MSSRPATGSEAWLAQLPGELRPAGLTGRTVGTAAAASAEALGTICYIGRGEGGSQGGVQAAAGGVHGGLQAAAGGGEGGQAAEALMICGTPHHHW